MIDRRKYIKDTYLRGINKYKHYFFEDKKNKCYISIKKILELDEPFFTRKGLCLINQNYYIVEIVPLHENYCIRVFVNDKKEIILYYFDITLQNGFDSLNDSLYYDDLYLDVVKQDENIDVLDEDELIEALENGKINKNEYELAITKKNGSRIRGLRSPCLFCACRPYRPGRNRVRTCCSASEWRRAWCRRSA